MVFWGRNLLSGERRFLPQTPTSKKAAFLRFSFLRIRPALRGADARSGFLGGARGALFLLKERPLAVSFVFSFISLP